MKTNKQIKRMISSVTGGEWVPDRLDKPQLMISVLAIPDDWRAFIAFHKTVSIKASEVKQNESIQRFL